MDEIEILNSDMSARDLEELVRHLLLERHEHKRRIQMLEALVNERDDEIEELIATQNHPPISRAKLEAAECRCFSKRVQSLKDQLQQQADELSHVQEAHKIQMEQYIELVDQLPGVDIESEPNEIAQIVEVLKSNANLVQQQKQTIRELQEQANENRQLIGLDSAVEIEKLRHELDVVTTRLANEDRKHKRELENIMDDEKAVRDHLKELLTKACEHYKKYAYLVRHLPGIELDSEPHEIKKAIKEYKGYLAKLENLVNQQQNEIEKLEKWNEELQMWNGRLIEQMKRKKRSVFKSCLIALVPCMK